MLIQYNVFRIYFSCKRLYEKLTAVDSKLKMRQKKNLKLTPLQQVISLYHSSNQVGFYF